MAKKKKKTVRKSVKKKVLKKKVVRKKAIKKAVRKAPPKKIKGPPVIGTVTHYFPKVRAAVVKLKLPLTIGEPIKIKGHTTDFQQTVASMQIDHLPVNQAKKGAEIGLEVESRVRCGDTVYKQQ